MKHLFALLSLCFSLTAGAQNVYDEAVETPSDADCTALKMLKSDLRFTWTDADVSLQRFALPLDDRSPRTDTVITAWRGERVGLRGVFCTSRAEQKAVLELRPANAAAKTAGTVGHASWLRYVTTDSFSTCGYHPDTLQAYTVAEVVDLPGTQLRSSQPEVRPFWTSFEVPRTLPAGDYTYTLALKGAKARPLSVTLRVLDRQLPEPRDYNFHLDLWQQPYSVARYNGVEAWSDDHFRLMRPYMEELARCGQKVVSAILFYEPWGQQSNDKFEPMIHVTKHTAANGDVTWSYDYSTFDRWVEFMAECGIDEQIDCYSMVPWDMTFRYYDEALRDTVNLKTTTDTPEYRDLWVAYLRDFAAHLREKGWFEKTCIAMDERGLDDMLRAYHIAQYAVPGLRMTLAGNYHKELAGILHDYALAYGQTFTPEEKAVRRAEGKFSTYYTCCTDAHPGLFSNSNPVDATFIPLYAAAADFDGWLHWSWLNWTDDPLRDSRFFLFAPGDTYFFYPGPRSSLRHERLLEGIQQYEKLRLVLADPTTPAAIRTAIEDDLFKAILNEPAQDPAALAQILARVKALVN